MPSLLTFRLVAAFFAGKVSLALSSPSSCEQNRHHHSLRCKSLSHILLRTLPPSTCNFLLFSCILLARSSSYSLGPLRWTIAPGKVYLTHLVLKQGQNHGPQLTEDRRLTPVRPHFETTRIPSLFATLRDDCFRMMSEALARLD